MGFLVERFSPSNPLRGDGFLLPVLFGAFGRPRFMTKVYGPLRRTYRSRSLGLVQGRLRSSAIMRAMKPRSGAASLAQTSLST